MMGSEDEGIDPAHLRICQELVRIPILGSIESLNVSVAAGVIMYEAVRQRIMNV
ncbi:MAG: TrmH family RNA methyltransferase [Paludibacter sp.]|nr:TrmH family RNA methyltransferase [Paludibacter sp.]